MLKINQKTLNILSLFFTIMFLNVFIQKGVFEKEIQIFKTIGLSIILTFIVIKTFK